MADSLTHIDTGILAAKRQLDKARMDGDGARIRYWLDEMNLRISRHKPARTLAEIDPDLDAHLRVNFKARC